MIACTQCFTVEHPWHTVWQVNRSKYSSVELICSNVENASSSNIPYTSYHKPTILRRIRWAKVIQCRHCFTIENPTQMIRQINHSKYTSVQLKLSDVHNVAPLNIPGTSYGKSTILSRVPLNECDRMKTMLHHGIFLTDHMTNQSF